MNFPETLQKEIIDFLGLLPNIHNIATQEALIFSAGLEHQLQKQIIFGGSVLQFTQELVSTLSKYGMLKDERYALEAVLEASKNFVGQDRKQYCDYLIQEFHTFIKERCEQFPQRNDLINKKSLSSAYSRKSESRNEKLNNTINTTTIGQVTGQVHSGSGDIYVNVASDIL